MGRSLLQAFYVFLSATFFIACLLFTFANAHVDRVINDIFIAIANGTSINEFSRVILGLSANGKFRIIETDFAAIIAVSSLVLSYIFLQAYLFSKRGISIREAFTKKYWTTFIPSMSYRKYIRKQKDED